MAERKSFIESYQLLQDQKLLDADTPLKVPERMPRYDDDEIGVSFFRTKLANMTLLHARYLARGPMMILAQG